MKKIEMNPPNPISQHPQRIIEVKNYNFLERQFCGGVRYTVWVLL